MVASVQSYARPAFLWREHMKRYLISALCITGLLLAVWLEGQTPPPVPNRPTTDEMLYTIVSNAVRSCTEEYTKTYVRAYARAFVAELSNQWAGVRSFTNVVPVLPQSLPQPCEHTWVPLCRYQQEHMCSRCGVKEWK